MDDVCPVSKLHFRAVEDEKLPSDGLLKKGQCSQDAQFSRTIRLDENGCAA